MSLLCRLLFVLCFFSAWSARGYAEETFSLRLEDDVQHFLEDNLRAQNIPGEIEIQPLSVAVTCPNPQPFLSQPQNPLLGRVTVGVRCDGAPTRYLFATIHRQGRYLIAARPIAAGEMISLDMLAFKEGALESLPRQILTDEKQAVGLQALRLIPSGGMLLSTAIRERPIVQKGARVTVEARGVGFRIQRDAFALEDGALDHEIRVRTDNGEVLRARVVAPNHLQLLQ